MNLPSKGWFPGATVATESNCIVQGKPWCSLCDRRNAEVQELEAKLAALGV